MKYFKTTPDRKAEKFEISLENFQRETGRKQPYEQEIDERGKFSQYAICPSCLNPIQLIGLVTKTKMKPYGRHTGKDIDGLPKWNYDWIFLKI